jgi:hypothetical protein
MGVDPRIADRMWPYMVGFLEGAIERCQGLYEADDIKRFIDSSHMQLWAVARENNLVGAIVTEIVIYPRKTCLWIAFAGGEGIHDCPEIMDQLAEWARDQGCAGIRAEGRKGWIRAAGMIETGACLWRDIEEQEQ